jgi:hypothetical protein
MLIPRQANDNYLYPKHAFSAQSIIRKRFGFYDRDVYGMSICMIKIQGSLHARECYFLSEETTQRHIESSLRSLARYFTEYGIERFPEDAVTSV